MQIRMADLTDLNACLSIDPSFSTDHVWQMEISEADEFTSIHFRKIKLPRLMKVSYPRDKESLMEDWRKGECFLVAHEDGEVVAYLDMTVQKWNATGWINNLVVARQYRRRGIGTALLRAAAQWAQGSGLFKLVAETQTKNYPAINFLQKNAYSFCGFNDQYYVNQDIALFFVQELR